MKTIVFICTGNTCRSPMAACMFAAMAEDGQWRVLSAGLRAPSGAPASDGAMRTMQRRGLSLDAHRSQPVTRDLLEEADLIVGMTDGHIQQLQWLFPRCTTPMLALQDPPVFDPYGGDDEAYERAACDIRRQLPALLGM